MKKIYMCLLFLFSSLVSMGQSKIAYVYDAAGNRVKREIVMQAPKAKGEQRSFESEEQMFSDMLYDYSVNIYPNPTEGTLKISILGLKDTDKCLLEVYTMQGAQIISERIKTDNIGINISSRPAGIYLLRIIINDKSTTWKIIKK